MPALIRLATLAIVSVASVPLLSANPAAAVVVNVSGIDYDVSAISTSYNFNSSVFGLPPLGQMPWWGDSARASEFATKVFDQLHFGWDPNYGPVFAYAIDTSLNQVLGVTQSIADINDQIDVNPSTSATVSYAVATAPVPLPLPLFGAAAGLAWSRRLRMRLQEASRSALSVSSASPTQ